MNNLYTPPKGRKDKLVLKAATILDKIVEKNKETNTLTQTQLKHLVDRVSKARTKELSGEISYLKTIFATM